MRPKFAVTVLAAILALAAPAFAGTEMPFEFFHNLIWIKVQAAGRAEPLNFLLDTGAGATVLNIDTVRELGMKLGAGVGVRGVNTLSVAHRVEQFDATASGIPLKRSLLAVNLSGASKSCQRRIDGLLGADFLQGRVVQIDYTAKKIRVLDRVEAFSATAAHLPVRVQTDGLCVPVEICGNKTQWLRLDTGCDEALHWVVSKPDGVKGLEMLSIGLSTGNMRYAKTSVGIGGERFSDVKTGVQEKAMFPGESGLLGNGLLSKFKVTIDAAHRAVILERNGA